ncbi:MAG: GSCFA domain-containing protein [Chitinophagales bacterium]|nr:GSCFA domain-containing protein [Chitinophagales bacterium]
MAEKAGKCRKIAGKVKLRFELAIFAAVMDAFRTVMPLIPAPVLMRHREPVLLMGSCFTEHIGHKLSERKFHTALNPFGIVYNPISLAEGMHRLYTQDDAFELFEHQGLWHSWDHHGKFSGPDQDETLALLRGRLREAAAFCKQAKWLVITFGTAEVSVLRESGRVVANNHKMPGPLFDQRRLSVTEVVDAWLPLLQQCADKQVILTVSPVRHLRQGLVENQRSKAVLLLACEELSRQLPHVHYFPSYELLMDDLRDYRFYAADMAHPSPVAIDYIWKHFCNTYFDAATQDRNDLIQKIRVAMEHRPFHPELPQHQAFLQAQLDRIQWAQQTYPDLDWTEEIQYFSSGLLS